MKRFDGYEGGKEVVKSTTPVTTQMEKDKVGMWISFEMERKDTLKGHWKTSTAVTVTR